MTRAFLCLEETGDEAWGIMSVLEEAISEATPCRGGPFLPTVGCERLMFNPEPRAHAEVQRGHFPL
jgi:hypothetical protein